MPGKLKIDTFDGDAWVSIVAFTMESIRPNRVPPWSSVSNFHEINVRTYVTKEGKQGVYFLNIEAEKQLAAWLAKKLSGLPYEKATIIRTWSDSEQTYKSNNKYKGFYLDTTFSINKTLEVKSDLDKWLTERYCLYLDKDNKIFRYETHHAEWKLNHVDVHILKTYYKVGNIYLDRKPDLLHYSEGVKVVSWSPKLLSC